jgi:hypothetical protein
MVKFTYQKSLCFYRGTFCFYCTMFAMLVWFNHSYMKELHDFQTSQLLNLLARETINYYKLIGYGATVEECTQCNNGIKQIQMELEARRTDEEKNFL